MDKPMRMGSLLLGACLLFGGCAGGNDASRSVIMAAPAKSQSAPILPDSTLAVETQDDAREDVEMELVTVTTGLSTVYTGSADGAYTMATYTDGSADLLYFDYAALRMTKLENPPRQNSAVPGAVQNIPGGAVPKFLNGMLYIFHLGGTDALQQAHGEAGQASVQRMGADGTSPTSCIFPAGWQFIIQSAVLCEGDLLYFLMTEQAGETLQTILVQLNVSTMEYEEIRRLEAGYEYSIEGCWRMGPIIQAATSLPPVDHPDFNTMWNNRQFALTAQGMYTGQGSQLAAWTQGQSVCVQNNLVYMWATEGDAVLQLDANDGNQSVLAQGFAPSGYVQAILNRNMLDGKLRVQFSTQRYVQDFIVDPATGAATQTPISQLGDNVTVCAEGPDAFLISHGEAWANKENIPYSFVPSMDAAATPGFAKMPQYALIAKADYWAGRRNFVAIADGVFDAKPRSGGGQRSTASSEAATEEAPAEDAPTEG